VLQVVGVVAVQREFEDLLDHGQEVVERANGRESGRRWAPQLAAGSSQQESGANRAKRDPTVMQINSDASIATT
jgi:hypothetical protein